MVWTCRLIWHLETLPLVCPDWTNALVISLSNTSIPCLIKNPKILSTFYISPSVSLYMCHAKFCNSRISVSISGTDPGFLRGDANPKKAWAPTYYLDQSFAKTAWRWIKLGRGGGKAHPKFYYTCRSATRYLAALVPSAGDERPSPGAKFLSLFCSFW